MSSNTLYKTKAKDSFKTKLRIFLFSKALLGDIKRIELTEFQHFIITEQLKNQFTTEYWQLKRNHKLKGSDFTIDEVYAKMKKAEEVFKDEIKAIESDYVSNFESIFKFDEFEKMRQIKNCCYCGITEEQLEVLSVKRQLFSKVERGYTLEVERFDSNLEYTKENCAMACYWCNNAKTDEFTKDEFKEVGNVIRKIWEKRKVS